MSVETIQFPVSPQTSNPEAKQAEAAPTAAKEPAQETPRIDPNERQSERLRKAEDILYRNTFWALGAGALMVPVADLLAASAVHLKQLKELAELYGVDFSEGLAKKLVGSLLMSLGGVGVGALAGSLIKLIPGVGTALGLFSQPAMVAASTRALGRVFIMHFESGGTFLDFDPRKMQDYFKGEFDKARQQVEQLKNEAAARVGHPKP